MCCWHITPPCCDSGKASMNICHLLNETPNCAKRSGDPQRRTWDISGVKTLLHSSWNKGDGPGGGKLKLIWDCVEWVTYHLHIPSKSHLLVATHGSSDSTPWQYSGRINWSRSCWWPSIATPLRVCWCTPTPRDVLDAQQPREKFYKGWSGQLKRQSAALSPPWGTLRAPDASPEWSGSPVTSSTLDTTCLACCPQERGTGV